MSYNVFVDAPGTEIDKVLAEQIDGYLERHASDPTIKETREALLMAARVSRDLVESGAYGNPEQHRFRINISGHCNIGHEPTQGWSDDFVSIQVIQLN